jgi:predicted nucleic acid-binding protein
VNGTVLVDTNVFTAPLRDNHPLQDQYRKHTFGRRIAVAAQTVAEARYRALVGGWGARRLNELARLTTGVSVVPVDDETMRACRASSKPVSSDRPRSAPAPSQR